MSDRIMSWEECAAAGMTAKEAAQHRGTSPRAPYHYAHRHGISFRSGRDCPQYRAGQAERARRQHATPGSSVLSRLTPEQRADYRVLRAAKYTREEALRAVGAP